MNPCEFDVIEESCNILSEPRNSKLAVLDHLPIVISVYISSGPMVQHYCQTYHFNTIIT